MYISCLAHLGFQLAQQSECWHWRTTSRKRKGVGNDNEWQRHWSPQTARPGQKKSALETSKRCHHKWCDLEMRACRQECPEQECLGPEQPTPALHSNTALLLTIVSVQECDIPFCHSRHQLTVPKVTPIIMYYHQYVLTNLVLLTRRNGTPKWMNEWVRLQRRGLLRSSVPPTGISGEKKLMGLEWEREWEREREIAGCSLWLYFDLPFMHL